MPLVVAFSTALATAQETPAPDPEFEYVEELAVEVVNVEVYVTDRDGNPVHGLTIDDFEVLEDGRSVELVNFYSVSDGRPVSTQQEEPVARASRETLLVPEREETLLAEQQRLHLIIYVDNFFADPLDRNRVLSQLRAFLNETLHPGDEVMLASYDRSLHIRHPFTSDRAQINRALLELEKLTGFAVAREKERADAVREIYESRSLHKAQFRASQFADTTYQAVDETLDGLREMLDSLAGLPGRKMLLHVSDGLPLVPGQDLYQAIQERFADQSALGEAMSYDLSAKYSKIIALANSNRTSFYTIDAGGLRTQSGMGAENPAVHSPYVVSSAVDTVRTSNLQDTLILMADRTGGQAIFNTNNVREGLERFAQDFENFYSLGYRAPTIKRGRYHDIEVRLKNPARGWRVRHREGYRDKSAEAQIEDAAAAFFVHGYQTNPLGVGFDIHHQSRSAEGNVNVSVVVRIPIENVTFIPRPSYHQGQLSLYFGAVDDQGRKTQLQKQPLELRIPSDSIELARQDEVRRAVHATMRSGPHRILLVVRDEISEVRSVVGSYVVVGGE